MKFLLPAIALFAFVVPAAQAADAPGAETVVSVNTVNVLGHDIQLRTIRRIHSLGQDMTCFEYIQSVFENGNDVKVVPGEYCHPTYHFDPTTQAFVLGPQ